jgi:hypothetical protein
MTALSLPALDGHKPMAFLAAVGLTRLLTLHGGDNARLSWSKTGVTAVLHTHLGSLDEVVDTVAGIVAAIPPDGALPGVPPTLPPPGEAPDKLRLPPAELRALVRDVGSGASEVDAWLSSLVTDLALDDKGRSAISLMAAPSGKQSMRTMLEKPLGQVRKSPSVLREALTRWRRYPGVTGEYLDHQVLFDAADAPGGVSEERGVPGATWLALMAYPMLRTTADGGDVVTTGWYRRSRRPARFVYPLWEPALDVSAIAGLLDHPLWCECVDAELPQAAGALGVFAIGRAQRRRISGRNFAGVLAPLQ